MENVLEHPQLIICDVDGTLIDETEQITHDFGELKTLITEHKLPFTLASGRCLDQLRAYRDALGISLPVIANNGASAYLGEEELWNDFMVPAHLREAIEFANDLDMVIIMGIGKSELVYRHNAYVQNQIETFGRYNHFYIPLDHEWPELKIQKLLITDPQKQGRIDQVIERLEPYLSELKIVRYSDRSIDVMSNESGKEKGIERLKEYLKVSKPVMTLGDSENDLEMTITADIGAVVTNATSAVKEVADYVATKPNILGVIEAVNHVYQLN